jgi:hypothetical protein
MKKQLTLAITLLMGLSFQNAQAGNECRLKYKYGNSGNKYKYVNKGQTINFTRSGFNMAKNVGRNDMRLTLQYVNLLGQTKTEYLYLIKNGGNTIALPPIPLINKKLKKIQCKNYAAFTDTQAYLQQFASSVSSIVSQATTTATSAVTAAANTAKNAFSASSANTYKNNTQAAIQSVTQAFNAAKSQASNTVRTNLSQHFPEVNQAVNASTQYGWGLTNAVMTQGEQNIRSTMAELERIDQKYAVSTTVSKLISVNLAKDFPEFNQLKNHQCKLKTNAMVEFTGGVGSLASELAKLDKKYQFSKTSKKIMKTLITLPSVDKRKLNISKNAKNCDRAWGDLKRKIDTDSRALDKYLTSVKAELLKLKAAQFKGSQGAFFREVQRLITATDALIKEHNAQKRRKQNMDKAEKANDKAYQQIKNDLGPIQDDLEKLPLGGLVVDAGLFLKSALIPSWLTDDPERLKVLLTREIAAAKSYRRSIEIHQAGKLKVKAKFDAFVKQTGVTLGSAAKLRIQLPKNSKLISLLKSPPQLRSLLATKNAVVICVSDFIKAQLESVEVIVRAIDQYLKNIGQVTADVIPSDVKKALARLNTAIVKLKSKPLGSATSNIPNKSVNDLKSSLNQLWNLFKQDPSKTNFNGQVQNLLQIISGNINKLKADGATLSSDIGKYLQSVTPVVSAISNLNKVMVKHRNSSMQDVNKVVKSAVGFKVKWSLVEALPASITKCAKQYVSLFAKAQRSLSSRLQKLLASKAQVAANALPKNIKDKLRAMKVDNSAMLAKFSQFKSASAQAYTAFQAMSTARNQAIAALVPIPKTTAPQKVQTALNKVNTLNQKLLTVQSKWQPLLSAQQKLTSDLNTLIGLLMSHGGAVTADAGKLASKPFDSRLIANQRSGITNVANKWNAAVQTLPSRVAALASGGMSTQVESQINQGLAFMNSKKNSLLTCFNTANSKRNSIGSQSQRAQAVTHAIAGLSAQALSVKNSLNALMPPKLSILNDISNSMTKARQLSDKIGGIGTTAANKFLSNINGLKSQLNSAKNCVISNHGLVANKKTQLMNLINQ